MQKSNMHKLESDSVQSDELFLQNNIKKQAKHFLNSLDYSKQQNRNLLAKAYRDLTEVLDKPNNFYLTEDDQVIDKTVDYAFKIKPYQYQPNLLYQSQICRQEYTARRRCSVPLVSIDGEPQNPSEGEILIYKDRQFTVRIEGEPNCYLMYTTGKQHPLMVPEPTVAYENIYLSLVPPCEISIVAIKEPHKIQSHLLNLKVKVNQFRGTYHPVPITQMGAMIRPVQQLLYDSNSSGNIDTFLNIENSHEFQQSELNQIIKRESNDF